MRQYNIYQTIRIEASGILRSMDQNESRFTMAINSTSRNSDLLEIYTRDKQREYIPVFIFYSSLILLGLVGNAFAYAFYRYRANKTVSSFFLEVLAANDFLTSFVLLDKIYHLYYVANFTSGVGCRILYFINHIFVLNSGLVLMVMNIDRYQHICKPFSDWRFKLKSAKITIAALFAFSVVAAVRNLVVIDSVEFEAHLADNRTTTGYRCTHSKKAEHKLTITLSHLLDLVIVIANFLIAIVVYLLIVCKILQSNRAFSGVEITESSKPTFGTGDETRDNDIKGEVVPAVENASSNPNPKRQNLNRTLTTSTTASHASSMMRSRNRMSERRITAMIFTVTLFTFVCSAPYTVVSLTVDTSLSVDEYELSAKARLLKGSFAIFSSINPYIICVFNTEFRKFTANFFYRNCICCRIRNYCHG